MNNLFFQAQRISLFFSLVSFTALSVQAGFDRTVGQYGPGAGNSQCVQDASDPFDPGYVIGLGEKFKGQCLDASTVRPPLKYQDYRNKEGTGKLIIANFYHKGKYWLAEVPQNLEVEIGYFQGIPFGQKKIGPFTANLSHAQARLNLKTPLRLVLQSGNQKETDLVRHIIVSSTITKPPGFEYDIGDRDHYGITTRIMSASERGVEEILTDGSQVLQFALELSPEAMRKFLFSAIDMSNSEGYQTPYGFLTNNCGSTIIRALDISLYGMKPGTNDINYPKGVGPLSWSLLNYNDMIIKPGLEALKKRGIKATPAASMNTEMSCEKTPIGVSKGLCKFNNGDQ